MNWLKPESKIPGTAQELISFQKSNNILDVTKMPKLTPHIRPSLKSDKDIKSYKTKQGTCFFDKKGI